jgi:hypothetical protein
LDVTALRQKFVGKGSAELLACVELDATGVGVVDDDSTARVIDDDRIVEAIDDDRSEGDDMEDGSREDVVDNGPGVLDKLLL